MIFNNAEIASVKRNDYKIHLFYMSKDETINILVMLNWLRKRNMFLQINIIMDKKDLVFGNIVFENQKFCCYKNQILIDDVDINKLIVSNNS